LVEEADTVLAQVGLTYRDLKSYSDKGFMESRDDSDSTETDIRKLTFSTHFRRPNFFRFEWRYSDRGAVNVIWCDGRSTFAKYSYENKARHVDNLSRAIAGATGVSGGTAQTVSCLLMEEVGGRKLTDMKNSVYLGAEIVNGEDCHHLQLANGERHIFISKSKSTVLRIDENYIIAAGSTEQALKSTRFSSFGLFMHWLHYAIAFRSEPHEDLRVIRSTVYDEVLLNPDIPDTLFSEAGPASKTL